jgi:hypothetical protein
VGQPTGAVSKGLLANMRQSHNALLVQRLWGRTRTLTPRRSLPRPSTGRLTITADLLRLSCVQSPTPDSPFALEVTKQVEVRDDIDLAWGLGVAVADTQERSYFHWELTLDLNLSSWSSRHLGGVSYSSPIVTTDWIRSTSSLPATSRHTSGSTFPHASSERLICEK